MRKLMTLFCLSITFGAVSKENEVNFLSSFILGSYDLIGKAADSDRTYFGKIIFQKSDDGLIKVIRSVSGQKEMGKAKIESTLSGESKVLRIHFTENEKDYEETCLIQSDLDNYARISCYLYQPGLKTNNPGLEAFFIEH